MLLIDRVYCDLCRCMIGQLYSQPAVTAGALIDKRFPPHLCLCPDCWDNSEVVEAK